MQMGPLRTIMYLSINIREKIPAIKQSPTTLQMGSVSACLDLPMINIKQVTTNKKTGIQTHHAFGDARFPVPSVARSRTVESAYSEKETANLGKLVACLQNAGIQTA